MDKEIKHEVTIDVKEAKVTEQLASTSVSNSPKIIYQEELKMLEDMIINMEKLKLIYNSESVSKDKEYSSVHQSPIYVTSDVSRQAENVIENMQLYTLNIWSKYIKEWLNMKKELIQSYNIRIKGNKDKKILKTLEKINTQEVKTEKILKELKKLMKESLEELNTAFNNSK